MRGLSWLETMLIVLAGSAVFLFGDGLFFSHVWDVPRVDRALWYSYAIVPLLVLGVLLLKRRLRLTTFLFGTAETTLYKFLLTFVIAHGAWSFADPAARGPRELPRTEVRRKAPLPPSQIDPSQTGTIRGRARPGSLVYVESGLEHLIFAPPDRTATITHDGGGFTPLSAVQVGQPLDVASHDARIHTLRAIDSKEIIRRNHAVIPAELTPLQPFDKPLGLLRLDCTVHRGAEHPAHLLVLAHPFFTHAAEDGTFRFDGVPAGTLRVTVLDRDLVRTSLLVDLPRGSSAEIDL
jgi:hypothetical protein